MSDPLEKALEVIREYHKNLREAQANADRRRELLKRALPLLKTNQFPNKNLIEDVEKALGLSDQGQELASETGSQD